MTPMTLSQFQEYKVKVMKKAKFSKKEIIRSLLQDIKQSILLRKLL